MYKQLENNFSFFKLKILINITISEILKACEDVYSNKSNFKFRM